MNKLEKLTLLSLLNKSADTYPDNIAVSGIDKTPITYSEFRNKVFSVTNFLKEQGIVAGDKVAILSENQPHWGIAYFAITIMGAIAVPIMTEFHFSEVHHILSHSESKAIFISVKFYNKVEEAEIAGLDTYILLDDFSIIPPNTKNDLLKEVIKGGLKEFSKIREAALKFVGLTPGEVREDDPALILYTSGTTGHSKGVILTHKNVISDAIATFGIVTVISTDRMLSVLPLFHTIESTLGFITPLMAGAAVYYMDKPPTAAALLPALAKVKPTVMLAVPLIIEKMFRLRILPEINKKAIVKNLYKLPPVRKRIHKAAGKKLMQTFGGELKMFCIGGAALAADVERFLSESGFPYAIGYGLTETSPLVTGTGPEAVRLRSAGVPLPGIEVKIINPDSKTGEGEIIVRGPNVMKGYYKDPERTREVLDRDGWFKTGDLGVIDKDKYLFIKGRSKNVIIGPNGKNIYPEEVESIINEMEFVSESLVLDRAGQLVAKVHLNAEVLDSIHSIHNVSEIKAKEIIESVLNMIMKQANERLATFSRLNKILEQREPFEKTPTQKIKRYLYV